MIIITIKMITNNNKTTITITNATTIKVKKIIMKILLLAKEKDRANPIAGQFSAFSPDLHI